MRVTEDKCVGCLECLDYCPVGAISEVAGGIVSIDEDECVECGCCLRMGVCEYEAIWQPELQWPRILRAHFSDPRTAHPSTGIVGRGTDEIKTNDVTGMYPRGCIGIAVELGRPGLGVRMYDVEKVAQAVIPLGVEFAEDNPIYHLFQDLTQGNFREDIRGEKVLSAILEFKTTVAKVPQVLKALHRAAREVDTVISMNIASMFEPDGSLPAEIVSRDAGFEIRPNGKSNVGLGLPVQRDFPGGKQ